MGFIAAIVHLRIANVARKFVIIYLVEKQDTKCDKHLGYVPGKTRKKNLNYETNYGNKCLLVLLLKILLFSTTNIFKGKVNQATLSLVYRRKYSPR